MSTSCTGSGRGMVRRWPTSPLRASRSDSAISAIDPISCGSSTIRRTTPARAVNRARRDLDADGVAHHVLEHVGLVEHDDVVLGQDRAAARHVQPVEVRVHDDHVGGRGAPPGLFGEARVAEGTPVGTGTLVAPDAHRPPRVVGRRPLHVGLVAGVGGGHPLRDPFDLHLRRQRHRVELELRLVGRRHLAEALQAHVVAPALQHREVEVDTEVLGEEREVLQRQLVLESLGGGGHHHGGPRLDGRHEVRQGLAGPGPGLDHEMAMGADRIGDPIRHLDLPEPFLGAGKGTRDLRERVRCDRPSLR